MINKKGGIKNRKRTKEIKGQWHGHGAISTLLLTVIVLLLVWSPISVVPQTSVVV